MLRESGMDARLEAEGSTGEIAVLQCADGPPTASELARLQAWSARLKRLGFRYVAVDLGRAAGGSE
jgi:hypothetical protein